MRCLNFALLTLEILKEITHYKYVWIWIDWLDYKQCEQLIWKTVDLGFHLGFMSSTGSKEDGRNVQAQIYLGNRLFETYSSHQWYIITVICIFICISYIYIKLFLSDEKSLFSLGMWWCSYAILDNVRKSWVYSIVKKKCASVPQNSGHCGTQCHKFICISVFSVSENIFLKSLFTLEPWYALLILQFLEMLEKAPIRICWGPNTTRCCAKIFHNT